MVLSSEKQSSGNAASLVTRHSIKERRRVHQANILLAEDDEINQMVAGEMLRRLGHGVTLVSTGTEAVALLKEARFDLAFMDIQMPEMDGFDATAAVREHEKGAGRHTPIVAMTAHALKGDREACLQAGMDDYVTKPIKIDALREVIGRWVQSPRDRSAGPEKPTDIAGSGGGKPADAQGEPPMDLADALERVLGDRAFLSRMVSDFIAKLPEYLDPIDNARAAGDTVQLSRAAHRLKGASASLGAKPLSEAARLLETEAGAGDLDEAEKIRKVLSVETDRFTEYAKAVFASDDTVSAKAPHGPPDDTADSDLAVF